MMRTFFKPVLSCINSSFANQSSTASGCSELRSVSITNHEQRPSPATLSEQLSFADQVHYLSDSESNESDDDKSNDNESDKSDDDNSAPQSHSSSQQSRLPRVPPLKCQRLDVPFRVQHKKKREEKLKVLAEALVDLEKVIKSKEHSLQVADKGSNHITLKQWQVTFG
jgi:hypothetical protein